MDPITASNSMELLEALSRIDISVPFRTEGRTTEDCERWAICRFLSTFADTRLIQYPCKIIHEDKPDFILIHSSQKIGIEVTEVVPQNRAAIDALREHKKLDGPFSFKGILPRSQR